MRIRFISDIHYYLNKEYGKAKLKSILAEIQPADYTFIAGDMSASLPEAQDFLNTYFKNEKVIFINGNHCLSEDTEVLTENGWKNITNITCKDKVYQYNKGYAELVLPERIVSNVVSNLYEFSSTYFQQTVTDQHRMVMSNGEVVLAKDLINKQLFQKDFILTCNTKADTDYPISDDLLKLLVWVVTDSTIVLGEKTLQKYTQKELDSYRLNPTKTRIQFHLSKQRKLDTLRYLLKTLNYNYTLKKCKKEPLQLLQPYYIRIYSDNARELVKLLEYSKNFPNWFLKLSKRQVKIVLDTLAITDGKYYINPRTKETLPYHITWGHTSKKDLDVLQACCIRHGFIFKYKQKLGIAKSFGNTKCKSAKTVYVCDIYTKDFDINTRQSKITITKKEGMFKVWCLTVPSGAFLIRCNGKTSITGNCVYNNTNKLIQEQIFEYKETFNNQWKFLENDYVWLNNDIAVIGCIGWTDYKYHSRKEFYTMLDDKGRRLDQKGNLLPENPADTEEFKNKSKKIWDMDLTWDEKNKLFNELYRSVAPACNERVETTFKERVSEEVYNNYINWLNSIGKEGKIEYTQKEYIDFNKRQAYRSMNDFRYGKMPCSTQSFSGFRYMNPDDCESFHKQSKKYIEKAYKEITAKNPNVTIILMTHHPFVKNCISEAYVESSLNAAFISDESRWLKKFPNIKYLHCGHVHSRCFDKTKDGKQIICNPLGYIIYSEHMGRTDNEKFNINYILDI